MTIPATGDRVETFADPDVIHGDDGLYYAYGTSDPLNDRDGHVADFDYVRVYRLAR